MTREEAEHKIAEKLKEIKKIAEVYRMSGNYLTLSIINTTISFNNEYWKSDCTNILNYTENMGEDWHCHHEI